MPRSLKALTVKRPHVGPGEVSAIINADHSNPLFSGAPTGAFFFALEAAILEAILEALEAVLEALEAVLEALEAILEALEALERASLPWRRRVVKRFWKDASILLWTDAPIRLRIHFLFAAPPEAGCSGGRIELKVIVMTPEEKEQLLEALDRIEYQPEEILIRQDDGSNVALSELPTLPALKYVCEWLRKRLVAHPLDWPEKL